MKIDVRGPLIILFIAVILKHFFLLLFLALQLALFRSFLFLLLLLHLLILTIDLRDLSLESHEQASPSSSSVLVGGGGDTPRISELLEEGCSLVLLLVQCQLPIPHI
jgi:hypothetical protein